MPRPIESLPPDVVEAWRAGRKIEAIKLLREKAGAGLAEAKAAIDALERAHGKVPGGLKVKGALPEVISALAKMKATHGDAATVGMAKAASAKIADLAATRDGLSPGEVPRVQGGSWLFVVLALVLLGVWAWSKLA
jgi:hypothetical protein